MAALRTAYRPGSRIADRFVLLDRRNASERSEVWQARDETSGSLVAVKIASASEQDQRRIEREARVLSRIAHPAVKKPIAYGTLDDAVYFCMEWLEGLTLADRLHEGRLFVEEGVGVLHALLDPLADLHDAGVIHRDIKPSNVFLLEGDVSRPILIDFGIAKPVKEEDGFASITSTGTVIGTPQYLAPEQARGEEDLDARADIFSIGALWYEMLTGTPAFSGSDLLAVLMKVVMEEPEAIEQVRPDLDPSYALLLRRMLAKDRNARPRDASEVQHALRSLQNRAPSRPPPTGLGRKEQGVNALALVGSLDGRAPMLTESHQRAVQEHADSLQRLADGTLVASFRGTGEATDLASRAARGALVLLAACAGHPVAMAVGASVADAFNDAMYERAVLLLSRARKRRYGVALDEIGAGLLPPRFLLGGDESGLLLGGERAHAAPARPVLGRLPPFIGRAEELSVLGGWLRRLDDPDRRRIAICEGPAGIGKSRIRYELLRGAWNEQRRISVLFCRADEQSAKASFAAAGQLLAQAACIASSDPDDIRLSKLEARLTGSGADPARIEAVARAAKVLRSHEDLDATLTRQLDPRVLRDDVARLFMQWLRHDAGRQPILIVVEDGQWLDDPSAELFAQIENIRDAPVGLLLCARSVPGAERFTNALRVTLEPFDDATSRELLSATLGEDTTATALDQLSKLGDGNPFALEELARAYHLTPDKPLPPTLLAIVQARIAGLPPQARRVLRVASVFGMSFSSVGVLSLLTDETKSELASAVEKLRTEELISADRRELGTGLHFAFRHALLREAAYESLHDDDRRLAHAGAAAWLERVDSEQTSTIARHYAQGGLFEKAAKWFCHAAANALHAGDFQAAAELAAEGLSTDPPPILLAKLASYRADALSWVGSADEQLEMAERALALAAPGTTEFWRALAQRARAAQRLGRWELFSVAVEAFEEASNAHTVDRAMLHAAIGIATNLALASETGRAQALLELIENRAPLLALEAIFVGPHRAMLALDALAEGRPDLAIRHYRDAQAAFLELDDRQRAGVHRCNLAFACAQSGDLEGARQELTAALEYADAHQFPSLRNVAMSNLAIVVAHLGSPHEGRELARTAAQHYLASKDFRMAAGSLGYAAQICLMMGEVAQAKRHIATALDLAVPRSLRARNLAVAAQAHRAAGELSHAERAITESLELLEQLGSILEGEGYVRLAHAEVCQALNDSSRARAVAEAALERIDARASQMHAEAARRYQSVPEHAALRRLYDTLSSQPDG